MKLIENASFDITEYCGHLIVTYLSDDKLAVRELLEVLDKAGYEYIDNEVGLHTVLKNSYTANIESLLDDCGCYILYVSKHFEDKKNRALRNNIWYQIGRLEIKKSQIVVPFVPHGTKADLSKTPLQQSNIISDPREILDMFSGKFYKLIARNDLYEDPSLNSITKDRIEYRRMLVSLDVTEDDFQKAMTLYKLKVNDLRMNEEKFKKVLRDKLLCGARLIAFGTDERLTTQLSPYREEMKIINTIDFPTNFTCKHVFKDIKDVPGIKGEYQLEIVLPIHGLLGVNFKCFIKAAQPLDISVLDTLFASNFREENDKVVCANAIYFSLNFPNAEAFAFDESLGIGTVADYLFPQ